MAPRRPRNASLNPKQDMGEFDATSDSSVFPDDSPMLLDSEYETTTKPVPVMEGLESWPTEPQKADAPGFRFAFNHHLVENRVSPKHYEDEEQAFRKVWARKLESDKDLKKPVTVVFLRGYDVAPVIGECDLRTRYPRGIRPNTHIQVPLFAARHLEESKAAIITRMAASTLAEEVV